VMLAIGLLYIAFIMLRYPSSLCFILAFIMKGYWILLKHFSASIDMISGFVFASVYLLYYV
jgi:hypothetical protein